jgi:tetratricopeptide (TPR) repeat protein
MEIDPNNPVVKLCAEGIAAEMAGRATEATALYQQAWEIQADDYDVCIVAHYMARVQSGAAEVLRWNQVALHHADALAEPKRVEAFYPSLHLNLGKSYEDMGNAAEARKFYELAERGAATLPDGRLTAMVRRGAAEGLRPSFSIAETSVRVCLAPGSPFPTSAPASGQ